MDLKDGDQVQLKSGGPVMTIESIGSYNGVQKALCIWFDGAKKSSDVFALPTLEKFE